MTDVVNPKPALLDADRIFGAPAEVELEIGGEVSHGRNGSIELTVMDSGRIFKRNAIKGFGAPGARRVCWLVAELDGVRLYVDGNRVVLTRGDLYP